MTIENVASLSAINCVPSHVSLTLAVTDIDVTLAVAVYRQAVSFKFHSTQQ